MEHEVQNNEICMGVDWAVGIELKYDDKQFAITNANMYPPYMNLILMKLTI